MSSPSMRGALRCCYSVARGCSFPQQAEGGVSALAAAAAAAAAATGQASSFRPPSWLLPPGFRSAASSSSSTSSPQTSSSPLPPTPEHHPALHALTSDLTLRFKEDAAEASRHIASTLSPAQRVALFSALRDHTQPEQLNDAYVEELYQQASREGPMTKVKFRDVMLAHVHLHDQQSTAPPSTHALWMVFLASAIPFVAFGFLDNFIMLTVGEEIDGVFGVRFGLTTLASAGLGNLVADVVGVSAAKAIEQGVKRLPIIREPRLSHAQKKTWAVKAFSTSGSLAGVMLGCCLGLLPLALGGHFFRAH